MSYLSLKDFILSINADAEDLIFKLYKYYDVNSFNDLSKLIDTPAGTISKWKQRNSVNAIRKKTRELGIYNDIFGDSTQIIKSNSGQIAQNVDGNQVFNPINTSAPTQPPSQKTENIDEATFGLFKEAYKKAKENSDLKGLRIHLMEY